MVLEHFVVEHREVESQTKFDRVAGGEIDGVSLFISLLSLLLDFLEFRILGIFGNIAVVIADHFDEEGLRLVSAISLEDARVDHVNDLLAVGHELVLDLGLVFDQCAIKLGVLGVLLDC